MGAWGFGVFDNDSSCDFVMDLSQESDKVKSIKQSLQKVIDEKIYIKLDDACAAWVSVCILDQKINGTQYDCPDIEYDDIIQSIDVSEIISVKSLAVKAINAIKSDISELKELISDCEEDDYNDWKSSLTDIKNRLL